ncbi:MAG: ATP-dependent helicase [Kiritimatiellia bacterium]
MTDFKTLLNEQQYEAATAGNGPLLVLAAAGTGKTRTLVYRVAYLYEQGVAPERMLLLTFTNRAAREMIERVQQTTGLPAGYMWSGTFHHICNRMLRRFGKFLGYESSFPILDREDSAALVGSCIQSQVGKKKDFPKKDVVLGLIGGAANAGLSFPEWFPTSSQFQKFEEYAEDLLPIIAQYHERKRANRAMDFDDLLVNGVRLLKESEEVRTFYQERFEHVLVDEYQDTNLLQSEFADILAARSRNILAVGDDFQCIYTWRGAHFANIMEFPKRWPDARIIKLERNYRSTPEILTVANCCIKGNRDQFQKTLVASRQSKVKPRVLYVRDGYTQAQAIVRLINHAKSAGYAWNEIAVLYRAHFHSIETQMMLTRSGIPHAITSGIGIFEKAHSKDLFAFLRLSIGPVCDYFPLLRLLCLLPGIGEKSAQKIWVKIGSHFNSQDPESRQAVAGLLRDTAQKGWAAFCSIFDQAASGKLVPGKLVSSFLDAFYSDYLDHTYEPEDAASRREDLVELGAMIQRSGKSLEEFLSEVALLTNLDRSRGDENGQGGPAVLLSTIHQAKGREWPVVIVPWMSEEMFPSAKALETGDDQEERRLFYVAVTRAKDELFLCSPAERIINGTRRAFCKVSRFLRELDKGIVINEYPTFRAW